MPTALESLVKILKLEREQGGKDTAVVGGLSDFCKNWEAQARKQARRPAHQILIDEIADCLADYDNIAPEKERVDKLGYLLDRITNRAPAPKKYQDKLPAWTKKMRPQPPAEHKNPSDSRSREHTDRRQSRGQRPRRNSPSPPKFDFRDEDSTWDEDYSAGPQRAELDIKPLPTLERPPRRSRHSQNIEQARRHLKKLSQPTTAIKGIGGKMAEALAQLDINTVEDLLFSFPRKYLDYTELKPIRELTPDETTTVIATVTHARTVIGANQRKDFLIRVADGSGTLAARFFNQGFLAAKIRAGSQIVLSGKVNMFRDALQMASPQWEPLELENLHTTGIVPVYRLPKNIRPRLYRKTLNALSSDWTSRLPDPIPHAVLERAELADLGWAMRQTHFPAGWDHLRHAQRRLAFDKLLLLQLAILENRRSWQSRPGLALEVSDDALHKFIKQAFHFELTTAQLSAIDDIRADMAKNLPMSRLLQGDVGSGKTAVAITAMAIALFNSKQSALMAPTSVLAEQHYRKIDALFSDFPSETRPVAALLTSALTASERESIYRGIADGSIDIVIGTQALIQEGVDFKDLGIVIIDEQHRFGVQQRAKLRGKGTNPHLLVMTATPIPRTLALTIYADLDLTLIDEKPPGRQDVITKIIAPAARERLHGFVIGQLEQGRQAFFVHPLVEESDSIDAPSAVAAFEELRKVFFRYRVCLLHGRMSPAEKDDLMAAFSRGEYDVMTTTSVAEVGVDIPNATVIVIDGANRFGLAQLHQFRGRVGRGQQQAYCFLIPDSSSSIDIDRLLHSIENDLPQSDLTAAEQRLAAMFTSHDGFALAELDWKLRGGGDLLGMRQSGKNVMQDLQSVSPELVQLAQREARTIVEEDPGLHLPEHQLMAERIQGLFGEPSEAN